MKCFETIDYSIVDSIATVTLLWPEKLNAINPPMVDELNRALDHAEEDPEVGVLLLTGDDEVSAERALALGLINRVVDADRLSAEAEACARQLASNDPTAVRLTKRAINRSFEIMGLRQALQKALAIDVEIESSATATTGNRP